MKSLADGGGQSAQDPAVKLKRSQNLGAFQFLQQEDPRSVTHLGDAIKSGHHPSQSQKL